jgi:hypothetical protein
MGRTESLNLKNDYERACGWYGHFNKSEMALFSECTDRYAQKLLDTADIVRDAFVMCPVTFNALRNGRTMESKSGSVRLQRLFLRGELKRLTLN